MKNILKKWLGLDALEEKVNGIEMPTNADLRKIVGSALETAMEGKNDWDTFFGCRYSVKNRVANLIEEEVARLSEDRVNELAVKRIEGEQFIDEVVERIKRKQVS